MKRVSILSFSLIYLLILVVFPNCGNLPSIPSNYVQLDELEEYNPVASLSSEKVYRLRFRWEGEYRLSLRWEVYFQRELTDSLEVIEDAVGNEKIYNYVYCLYMFNMMERLGFCQPENRGLISHILTEESQLSNSTISNRVITIPRDDDAYPEVKINKKKEKLVPRQPIVVYSLAYKKLEIGKSINCDELSDPQMLTEYLKRVYSLVILKVELVENN